MPKQGGQGKGKPKKGERGMGKALVRQHVKGHQGSLGVKVSEEKSLKSVLDNSALDDFVGTAVMGDAEIEVKKVHKNDSFLIQPTVHTNLQTMVLDQYDFESLRIPRKPAWSRDMTGEQVDKNERAAFLSWRREIATIEAARPDTRVTPFEKNIEVWRQLWRVIERCDIAIQIVDARNPLLYYSKDLMKYASEHKPVKPMMILVNKADFLTERQRIEWSKEFLKKGIKFAFYSAFNAQKNIDNKSRTTIEDSIRDLGLTEQNNEEPVKENEDSNSVRSSAIEEGTSVDVEYLVQDLKHLWASGDASNNEEEHASSVDIDDIKPEVLSSQEELMKRSHILNREELIYLISRLPLALGISPQTRHKGRVCVGLVGFPNVGKSSVINTILGVSKSSHGVVRVGVGSTPGKTKHFQTVDVNESLMLCDCPGLVFPSFMNNTSDMLCSGVLPINHMRDYVGPATVIASKVPQHLLEAAYGMSINRDLDAKDNPNRPPTSSEFLTAYCKVKSYVTGHAGRWDEFRACKEILRDFNDGKILYVAAPPAVLESESSTTMQDWLSDVESIMARNAKVSDRLQSQKLKEDKAAHESKPSEEMVFGDGCFESDGDAEDEFFDEDDILENDDVMHSAATNMAVDPPKREHKKIKQWGKKNRKLRDKNPYDDKSTSSSLMTKDRVGPKGRHNKKAQSRATRFEPIPPQSSS